MIRPLLSDRIPRRQMLRRVSGGMLSGCFLHSIGRGAERSNERLGYVIGEPNAEQAGARVLAAGGNAVDAIVSGALAAAVAAPHQTGIGGYGMHAIFAVDGGKRVVAVDGNSAAPAAMKPDTFRPGPNGKVAGRINEVGWLASGVPGILAGLQLAIDQFGTRSFAELVQPAIGIAREGIRWPAALTNLLRSSAAEFQADPGSRKLYYPDGEPLAAGSLFKNPELAQLLESLATANSVDAFYRGAPAQQIADAFQRNGGLVTASDLANYQLCVVEPIQLPWGEDCIYTPPLTAGGLTVIQALRTLQAMRWEQMPASVARTHARLEALRLAWRDRLRWLGDPALAAIPQEKLLSADYAGECAELVTAAVKQGKILHHAATPRDQPGTIHLSAADASGNFAALTLTHGNGFGARVTVDGLGLTLGHGMSRFDPQPDHPNGPGPGKRPLHNMVPTIVTRGGRPILAVGGRGGRKIPNAVFELLAQFVILKQPLAAAIAAPRSHTEGTATMELEKAWSAGESAALAQLGYDVKTGSSAVLSAVGAENGRLRTAMR